MNPVTKTFQYGDQTVTLETGRIARQATGSVLVTVENTSVLCTVVAEKTQREGRDFFPLAVHYVEKTYSVGKIPGGFFKREARPSEKETLTSRLIDRPMRPLFPNGFMNEVQVVCTVMSADKSIDPDIPAMIGTSAALAISGAPFNGPIGGARVGFSEDKGYILNYKFEEGKVQDNIKIALKYSGNGKDKKPAITKIERISKPGLRKYAGAGNLPRVLNGLGIAIVSTSKGVMTNKKARQENVGGEVLCFVY